MKSSYHSDYVVVHPPHYAIILFRVHEIERVELVILDAFDLRRRPALSPARRAHHSDTKCSALYQDLLVREIIVSSHDILSNVAAGQRAHKIHKCIHYPIVDVGHATMREHVPDESRLGTTNAEELVAGPDWFVFHPVRLSAPAFETTHHFIDADLKRRPAAHQLANRIDQVKE